MDPIFFPIVLMIAVPPLGLVPALLFGACFRRLRPQLTRSGAVFVVAGALSWFGYTLYECAIWVWSQGVTAPIRVDLQAIAPILYLVSFLGLLACWKARRAR